MLFRLLLIFCFFLPFQIALSPSAGVDLASARVFILGLFFIWLASSFKNKKVFFEKSWTNFFLLSFIFLNLFSLVFAQNRDWSIRKLLFLFSIFPLYFVVSASIETQEKMEQMIKRLVWGGFFVATMGVVQFIFQFIFGLTVTYQFWAKNVSAVFLGQNVTSAVLKNPSWLVNISGSTYLRAIATLPDPHMLSFFLGMILPLALGLYLKLKQKSYLAIFLVILIADLLTFSRGGYVGLFAGSSCAFFLLLLRLKSKQKIKIIASMLIIGAFLIIPSPTSKRFFSSFNFQEGSNQGRLETWRKAGRIILEHPLFGVGLGNYPLEVSATANYRDPIYAHSNYLDILAETGVFSLVVWLGFLSSLGLTFFKKSKKNILFFCAMLSLIIFSVHALVETSIYSPVVLPLFLIIAGFNRLARIDEKTF